MAAESDPSDTDHYFSATPSVASDPGQVELVLPGHRLRLATDRGVFARDGVDPGTRFLLSDAPSPTTPPATALDLGCGYGPIALGLAVRFPEAAVWAVDVNERAVELCRANATANNCSTVTAGAPDDVPADVRFDLIWSNPPVRVGKAALHELLRRWLRRLTPGGEAVLVVQKHLGSDSLQRWLVREGWPTERVASRRGYRLLRVEATT